MAGWITNGVPQVTTTTGAELTNFDTQLANGINPQTGSVSLQQLASLISFYGNDLDKTMVASSRYYSSINIGFPSVLTGISMKVGGTGGTDSWIFELHSPTGALLATTATAGTTAGATAAAGAAGAVLAAPYKPLPEEAGRTLPK